MANNLLKSSSLIAVEDTFVNEDEPTSAKRAKYDALCSRLDQESRSALNEDMNFLGSKLIPCQTKDPVVKVFTLTELANTLVTILNLDELAKIEQDEDLYANGTLTDAFYESVAVALYKLCMDQLDASEQGSHCYFIIERIITILTKHKQNAHIVFNDVKSALSSSMRSGKLNALTFKKSKTTNLDDGLFLFPESIRPIIQTTVAPFLQILQILNHVCVESDIKFETCVKSSYKGGNPVSNIDAICITLKKRALIKISSKSRESTEFYITDNHSYEIITKLLYESVSPQPGAFHTTISVCRPEKFNEMAVYPNLAKCRTALVQSAVPDEESNKFILIDRIYISKELNGYHQIKIYPCQLNIPTDLRQTSQIKGDVYVLDFTEMD